MISFLISSYPYNWATLSNVGQSYGLIGTVLSGAALLGVLVTVSLQRRQTRLSGEQAARQLHFDMMQQAWQDPALLEAIEVVPREQRELARQSAYVNFYFMYLRMGYRANSIGLGEIEDLAAHSFSTPAGRYYWERSEGHMRKHLEKQFIGALSRGYARAQTQPEGLFLTSPDTLRPSPSDQNEISEDGSETL